MTGTAGNGDPRGSAGMSERRSAPGTVRQTRDCKCAQRFPADETSVYAEVALFGSVAFFGDRFGRRRSSGAAFGNRVRKARAMGLSRRGRARGRAGLANRHAGMMAGGRVPTLEELNPVEMDERGNMTDPPCGGRLSERRWAARGRRIASAHWRRLSISAISSASRP